MMMMSVSTLCWGHPVLKLSCNLFLIILSIRIRVNRVIFVDTPAFSAKCKYSS